MIAFDDAAFVQNAPKVSSFLEAFDSYLSANELRCPSPRISESLLDERFTSGGEGQTWPRNQLLIDANFNDAFTVIVRPTYWTFNRSFPLADACAIWTLVDTDIDRTLIDSWRRKSKKEGRDCDRDYHCPLHQQIFNSLDLIGKHDHHIRIAGYCLEFAGHGKRSRTFQNKCKGGGVPFLGADPILIETSLLAFKKMNYSGTFTYMSV